MCHNDTDEKALELNEKALELNEKALELNEKALELNEKTVQHVKVLQTSIIKSINKME